MHFPIVTLSTVGYGDILPAGNLVCAPASIESVLGVPLLRFGFSEIFWHTRSRKRDGD